MPYMFKQKLNIGDLVHQQISRPTILFAESEEYLSALYKKLLADHNFAVVLCREMEALTRALETERPHLLIINPAAFVELQPLKLLRSVTENFPHVPVVTLGYDIPAEVVTEFMSLGVLSHINRKLTRPHDVISIINMVLGK